MLISIKQKTYDNWQKRLLYKRMRLKHANLLEVLKEKDRIKVIFLAIHKSVWKVDTVFKRMQSDPLFEPVILVCPYMVFGKERMRQDLKDTYEYFEEKGYPVISSYSTVEERWITLEELEPDIIFFTNPHKLTLEEYYEKAYLNYLTCYVPYAHDVSKYDRYQPQYNQYFHNAIWKIFAPHDDDLKIFKDFAQSKGKNVYVTGYPACEPFFDKSEVNPWKINDKKKIIWAPHHTIEKNSFSISNFLALSYFFKQLAQKYKNEVQFAFKPHPLLKQKLYNHPEWGVNKTNEYYLFWEESENTQLNLGDYCDLFKQSDAMIHDSGSFLAEYHYVNKPVFYICNESVFEYLNPFGLKALESCQRGFKEKEIEDFIISVIEGNDNYNNKFYKENVSSFFLDEKPSERIVRKLKRSLKEV